MRKKDMMTKNVTVLGALALLGAVALTACSQPADPSTPSTSSTGTATASATPSPTASKTTPAAAPTTDEEAQKQAFAAVKAYWAMEDQIQLDHGKNPDRIDTLATGTAAETTKAYAKARAESPNTAKGTRSVTPWGGYTSQLTVDGKAYPHGTADLKVCNDMSDVFAIQPNGKVFPTRPDPLRQVTQVQVVFVPAQGKWMVTQVSLPKPVQPC
ncbi:hypothetical protein [Arthrobacter woluwensis]|uniref:hypothetical protein n=1 Tax=Arthrobacter woluwensis TaxID=156980 RepID=UPI00382914E5